MRAAVVFAMLVVLWPVSEARSGEAGWSEAAAVTALEANQDGRFVMRLDMKKSVSGCRSVDTFYADYGRDGTALMYETALDALKNKLTVQVYVTGGCDLNGYSAISAVRVLP